MNPDFFPFPFSTSFLFSPQNHLTAFTRARGRLIAVRIRQIAKILALLTLCWIVVDALFLRAADWYALILGRSLTVLAFIILARLCLQMDSIREVYLGLFMLFTIPMLFLIYATFVLHSAGFTTDHPSILTSLYFYAPFIIASGVGFFPLALIEAIFLLGIPIILATGILVLFLPDFYIFGPGFSIIWILLLILCTSSLIGVNQLGFMLELFDNGARDGLTGLFARSIGAPLLSQQFDAAVRNNLAFSVLFFDLDHFKQVNDNYGHQAGDAVLAEVANRLRQLVRSQDIVIRWGGEEFLVAFPGSSKAQAEMFLKRLAAEGIGFIPNGRPVTASIGIAERYADDVKEWQSLVDLADKRTYMAKQAGRNCYVLMEEALPFLQRGSTSDQEITAQSHSLPAGVDTGVRSPNSLPCPASTPAVIQPT